MLLLFTVIQVREEQGPPSAPYFCSWAFVHQWRIAFVFTATKDSQTAKAWASLASFVTSITLKATIRSRLSPQQLSVSQVLLSTVYRLFITGAVNRVSTFITATEWMWSLFIVTDQDRLTNRRLTRDG